MAQCQLCTAAEAWDGDPETLSKTAKEHDVTEKQLKIRLDIPVNSRVSWTSERLKELTTMLDEGRSYIEVAKHFNIKIPRLKQVITANEIDTSKGESRRLAKQAESAAMISEGVLAVYRDDPSLTPEQISAKVTDSVNVEVAPGAVYKILSGLGLPVNTPGRKNTTMTAANSVKRGRGRPRKQAEPSTSHVEPSIEDSSTAKYVAAYISDSNGSATLEGYVDWAQNNDAPTSTQVRREFGSWAEAKRAAEPYLAGVAE